MRLWILIGLNIITKVYGFTNGNFEEVCDSMLPEHKRRNGPLIPAQTTEPPYDVFPEPGNEGNPVTVTLKSRSETGFLGFMLEARERINGKVTNRTVGQFIVLDLMTRLLTCNKSEGAAVSQRNNQKKTSIQVNWTAPGEEVDVTFRATFLETFDTFWINVDEDLRFPPTTPAPSTQPSTTESTTTVTETATLQVANDSYTLAGIAAISVDSFLVVLNMGLPNIFITVLPSGPLPRRLSKVSEISCCLLCAAVEISSVVLFCLAHPIQVTLVALVCVAIAINFIALVIVCLPIGPSHELKEICDHAVRVCCVIHLIFTTAVIFVGGLKIDNYRKSIPDYWLLEMMITFTVWTFLFLIWDFVSRTKRNTILWRGKIGSQQSKAKKPSVAGGIVAAVSVIFILGSLCFAVSIAVGIFGYQQE